VLAIASAMERGNGNKFATPKLASLRHRCPQYEL
jgi:hypothetical protein